MILQSRSRRAVTNFCISGRIWLLGCFNPEARRRKESCTADGLHNRGRLCAAAAFPLSARSRQLRGRRATDGARRPHGRGVHRLSRLLPRVAGGRIRGDRQLRNVFTHPGRRCYRKPQGILRTLRSVDADQCLNDELRVRKPTCSRLSFSSKRPQKESSPPRFWLMRTD